MRNLLVSVHEGTGLLDPKGPNEKLITKGRPISWRASCRAVVGFDNKPGAIKLSVKPQSRFEDELDPGVRSMKAEE